MRIMVIIIYILSAGLCRAQKGDTMVKYLDKHLAFTSKASKFYRAIAFPKDGHYVLQSFYNDGSKLVEAYFLDKKLTVNDGRFIVYFTNGIPGIEGMYNTNYRSGVWRSWYTNGNTKDSGALVNNVLVGKWVTYYQDGTMKTREHFNEQAGSTGLSPLEARKKISLLRFPPVTAIKSGVSESWSANGQKKDSGSYANDLKTGYWKSWYDNGKPESEGSYGLEEKLQGNWTFYREDGTISTEEKYADNKLTDLKCYDEKGTLTGSFCSIAKLPVLLGTPYDWQDFFESHLVWSKESMKRSHEALITIRFTVGKDGKLVSHKLLNSPSQQVSEDIEKVIRLMKDWSPAVSHNRTLEYSIEYSFTFYPG
jgi:antitoxin component YwqK of YwqJK toxin-antitoxin module